MGDFYTAGGATIGSRYLRRFGPKVPDVGFVDYSPAVPAYTEVLNEGGEIIKIYYPAIPAASTDISNYFSAKGSVAGYIRVPYVNKPIFPNSYDKTITARTTGNGTLAAASMFDFEINAIMFDSTLSITEIDVYHTSFGGSGGGSVYSPLTKIGGLTYAGGGAVVYRQRYQVGLSTSTSYTGGTGQSSTVLRLYVKAKGSNGVWSDSPTSNHAAGQKILVFDVILRHYITPS